MKMYLFAAAAGLTLCGLPAMPAIAADVLHTRISGLDIITVDGDIKIGDDKKFRRLAVAYPSAVVALSSEGGMLIPALEIGKIIKINGHSTVVLEGSDCASSCALIWVAGSTKYLSPNGRVGFHASYQDQAGRRVETGIGNALIGHYLGSLNLSERAVAFATVAPPDKILWLNAANMSESGIEFRPFPPSSSSQAAQVTAPTGTASMPVSPHVNPTAPVVQASLPANTAIMLRMNDELTTRGGRIEVGHKFRLSVVDDVRLGNAIVIPRGTPAFGEVTWKTGKGAFGKSGKMEINLRYIDLNGRRIPLSGQYRQEGEGNTVATIAAVVAVGVFGAFVTGKSATIPQGRELTAHTTEPLPVIMPPGSPPPANLAVPIPTAPIAAVQAN